MTDPIHLYHLKVIKSLYSEDDYGIIQSIQVLVAGKEIKSKKWNKTCHV